MAQLVIERYGVYENPFAEVRRRIPYVVVVQSEYLYKLESVVVLPLAREGDDSHGPLTPRFDIDGESLILVTQQIAFVPRRRLKKQVATLETQRDRIIRAIDFLLAGI